MKSENSVCQSCFGDGGITAENFGHVFSFECPDCKGSGDVESQKDYEETWEEFWKSIVMNEDGTLNLKQIKKELHDFRMAMELVPTVYDSITGGRHTKILTRPEYIIQAAEDYFREIIESENEGDE